MLGFCSFEKRLKFINKTGNYIQSLNQLTNQSWKRTKRWLKNT